MFGSSVTLYETERSNLGTEAALRINVAPKGEFRCKTASIREGSAFASASSDVIPARLARRELNTGPIPSICSNTKHYELES